MIFFSIFKKIFNPCGSVLPTMEIPVLVHRQRGTVLYFHQAISEKKIIAIPGIHDFDAHRLDTLLLNAPELQLHPRAEPEGVGDAVDDPSSDEELSTTDGDTSDDDEFG